MQTSIQAPAAAQSYRQTSMKQWIVGAIRSLNKKKKKSSGHSGGSCQNKIVCSSEYMSCAFIIAHSLADQLSAIEEQRSYETERGEAIFTPQLNRKEQWSNCIYVRLAYFQRFLAQWKVDTWKCYFLSGTIIIAIIVELL